MAGVVKVANTAASIQNKHLATLEDTVQFLGVTTDADPPSIPNSSAWIRINSGPPAYAELRIVSAGGAMKITDLGTFQ